MRRFGKEKKLFERVRILDAGSEGNAIGKIEDKVVFVPFVVPGDLVDIEAFKNKKSYYEGKAVRFHEFSDKRTQPRCEHFGICGGCRWQNMKYSEQLFYKQKQVKDNIERIGKFEHPEILPIIPSEKEFFYRNKLEFTFSNKKWLTDFSKSEIPEDRNMNGLGFHIPRLYDRVVDLDNCYLQDEPSNSIRKAVKQYSLEHNLEFFDTRKQTGFLRNLLVRTTSTGEVMVIMVFHFDDKEAIREMMDHIDRSFPELTSLMFVINTKRNDTINDLPVNLFKGRNYIVEVLDGLKFRIGPVSFFQTNSLQVRRLYKTALEFSDLKGNEIVYDLYTGTGTIANFVASKAEKVIGIESVEAAIEDAKINSEINQIVNTAFFAGDIAKVLNDLFVSEHGKPDVIITDPPRAGMHDKVIEQILTIGPDRIIYISCNPATQARDVSLLAGNYTVEIIQPIDMFPHTHHVENVMLLKRK
jgi:23S rRNA (uracil1939-C5)-methyltransferase